MPANVKQCVCVRKLSPSLLPIRASLPELRLQMCVYAHHLPSPGSRQHRRGVRGAACHSLPLCGSGGPSLFVLVSWPAVSCLVWGHRIRSVFLSEFGAVRGEKDPRLSTPRAWPFGAGFSRLLLGILAPAMRVRTLPSQEGSSLDRTAGGSPCLRGQLP